MARVLLPRISRSSPSGVDLTRTSLRLRFVSRTHQFLLRGVLCCLPPTMSSTPTADEQQHRQSQTPSPGQQQGILPDTGGFSEQKPSASASILKERRFKLSRCVAYGGLCERMRLMSCWCARRVGHATVVGERLSMMSTDPCLQNEFADGACMCACVQPEEDQM